MAEWAVRYRSANIALACRAFSISETCYRYQPKLSDENELIADWLVTLTTAKKTGGFGLCFLHLLHHVLHVQSTSAHCLLKV